MIADKKSQFGKIKWTLLKHIGEAMIDVEVPDVIVKEAIEYITKK